MNGQMTATGIESLCINPQCAKKLKELGILQKSVFYYNEIGSGEAYNLTFGRQSNEPALIDYDIPGQVLIGEFVKHPAAADQVISYSAYTLGELARMMGRATHRTSNYLTENFRREICRQLNGGNSFSLSFDVNFVANFLVAEIEIDPDLVIKINERIKD